MYKDKGKVDVSAAEFLRSRNRQEIVAKATHDEKARRMMLYYAVECGGKYQLLTNEGCHVFSMLSKEDQDIGHDLGKLCKRIGIDKYNFPDLHSKHNKQVINVSRYQEMWRYGVDCEEGAAQLQQIEEEFKRILQLLHDIENRR